MSTVATQGNAFIITIMKTLLTAAFALLVTSLSVVAGGPEKITDINLALTKAKAENKVLFLQMGRESCENCQALRAMVSKKEVQLPAAKFVYADVNCDDPATMKVFRKKFRVVGSTLPFVVVTAPDGSQIGARSGPGAAADFEKLIHDAAKKLPATKS